MRSWGLCLYTLHRHAERIPLLDLEMGNMVKVQHYEMWAVGNPVVDQSSPVETNIIQKDNEGGLLRFLFLWEDEDIYEFIKEC